MESDGICVLKNVDETVRLHSEKIREWVREVTKYKSTRDIRWPEQRTSPGRVISKK